jgi:hypothetical protein
MGRGGCSAAYNCNCVHKQWRREAAVQPITVTVCASTEGEAAMQPKTTKLLHAYICVGRAQCRPQPMLCASNVGVVVQSVTA